MIVALATGYCFNSFGISLAHAHGCVLSVHAFAYVNLSDSLHTNTVSCPKCILHIFFLTFCAD